VLWDRPAASIRQITESLYPRNTASHYGTVQKQLERLEGKAFVRRDRSLFVHLFSAAVDRDALVGRRLDAVMDKLCGGSLEPILTHLLRAPRLTDEQRRRLRELIDRDDEGEDEGEGRGPAGKRKGKGGGSGKE
jgi:predicted transcriptional regulator